jgi:hypothetical protein
MGYGLVLWGPLKRRWEQWKYTVLTKKHCCRWFQGTLKVECALSVYGYTFCIAGEDLVECSFRWLVSGGWYDWRKRKKNRAVILRIRSRIGGILKVAWSRGSGVRLGRFPTIRRHFDCRICIRQIYKQVWSVYNSRFVKLCAQSKYCLVRYRQTC